jgi:hypothetical protein
MTTFEPNAGATMPARLSLTKAQRDALLLLPDTEEAFELSYFGFATRTLVHPAPIDQTRGDLYTIQNDLDFIKGQLAQLPTRNEVWRAAMLGDARRSRQQPCGTLS